MRSQSACRSRRTALRQLKLVFLAGTAAAAFSCTLQASPTLAASTSKPWWHVTSNLRPAALPPLGGEGTVVAQAVNLGNEKTTGPIVLKDLLPEGLEVQTEVFEGVTIPKV